MVKLSKDQFEKLFSADEANALIPRLEVLMRKLQMQAVSMRACLEELSEQDPEIVQLPFKDAARRHPQLRSFAAAMAEAAEEIESLGCFLKDLEQGLVDFPADDGSGGVVFLCWQFGEPQIVAWHSIDSGFASRQPLPGAPKLYLN
ncbi:MAG TPA: DUF2203 domain-containing protein [Candidatus Binataceae bacterium]|nr:DUF2203 domain-containing protein [Candidatus Binataceae bacterium]